MATHHQGEDLEALVEQLDRLRIRYGNDYAGAHHVPLRGSIERRRHRITQIRRQIDELSTEAATLERELLGYRAGLVAHLTDLVDRLRTEHGEGWSPTPIIGYRMWALLRDRLEGVRTVWRSPRMRAECASGYADLEVPHTDGRCGRLGCGVYAAKQPEPVLESFTPGRGHGYVAGRVALTGKVVEHDTGYRGEIAEVTAVVAVWASGTLATRDPGLIEALFTNPHDTMGRAELQRFWTPHMISRFLTEAEEDPWTSESNVA